MGIYSGRGVGVDSWMKVYQFRGFEGTETKLMKSLSSISSANMLTPYNVEVVECYRDQLM